VPGVCKGGVRVDAMAQVPGEDAKSIRIHLPRGVEQDVARAFDGFGADVLHCLGEHRGVTEADLAASQEILGCRNSAEEASHLAACHSAADGETATVAEPGNKRGRAVGYMPTQTLEPAQTATELSFEAVDRAPETHQLLAETSVGEVIDVVRGQPVDGLVQQSKGGTGGSVCVINGLSRTLVCCLRHITAL
jgi:hypothetical protein